MRWKQKRIGKYTVEYLTKYSTSEYTNVKNTYNAKKTLTVCFGKCIQ